MQIPKKLSVVVAVLNEEKNIRPLAEQLYDALEDIEYEIIIVNDGSTDRTAAEVIALRNPNVKLINLMKNFGQSYALSAGIDNAIGEYILTMDGDLQNDPSDIKAMLLKIEQEDYDVVTGIRAKRQDGMFLRKIPSRIANSIIRNSTGVHIKDYGCTLKIFKKEIAQNLGLYGELHRFIPVLAQMQGARIASMDVKHHARQFGVSKYGINRTFKVMSDLMLMVFFQKYMKKPMHLFGTLGLFTFFAGVGIDMYMVILKILGNDIWGKPMMILGVMLTLGGIQLITVGIIAEMLMRTYYESQNKKPYVIRSIQTGVSEVLKKELV